MRARIDFQVGGTAVAMVTVAVSTVIAEEAGITLLVQVGFFLRFFSAFQRAVWSFVANVRLRGSRFIQQWCAYVPY